MGLVHVTVSDAGGGSDQSMPPAKRRGAITHQSLLHGQLLSARVIFPMPLQTLATQRTWSVLLNT